MKTHNLKSLAKELGISQRTISRLVAKHRDYLVEHCHYDSKRTRFITLLAVKFLTNKVLGEADGGDAPSISQSRSA